MGRHATTWTRVGAALLIGPLCAWALLAGLASLLRWDPARHGPGPAKVARALDKAGPKRVARMQWLSPPQVAPKAVADKPKPPPERELSGQIVQTARPDREQRPTESAYLGRYDMAVPKEQKAREVVRNSHDLGRVRVDEPSALQSPKSRSREPTSLHTKKQEHGEPATEQSAPPPKPGAGESPPPMADKQPSKAGGSVVVRGEDNGLLLPATSPGNVVRNLQALSGSPGRSDWLPDVEDEGDTNLLNTRKFRYWDFFERIRDRVGQEWEPGRVWRARDPTGQRYGVKSRLTVVRVTLDPEGALKHLRVAKESGLDFLDDEAQRAFAAAGPFPNPPAGLRNAQGEIEFRFGFLFEITSQRFRMRGWQ